MEKWNSKGIQELISATVILKMGKERQSTLVFNVLFLIFENINVQDISMKLDMEERQIKNRHLEIKFVIKNQQQY